MTTATEPGDSTDDDHDVVIVGGGPAGSSAGVFTARYGLDTIIFDRGRSSLRRCAYLENYLGFPGGIDVETLYSLIHDHAERAGCDLASALVESVAPGDDNDGFIVETQEGRRVNARHVVAATRYDGEYLRPLDDGEMFTAYERDGAEREQVDRAYPDADGRTPVDGLYVASPSEEADHQAIMAAGRGARVGLTVVADVRRNRGYPATVAVHYDWTRREAELDDEWHSRERWREWFDDRLPENHNLDEKRRDTLREAEIDRRLDEYLAAEEIDHRVERGQKRLLSHIDDDLILDAAHDIETERESTEVTD